MEILKTTEIQKKHIGNKRQRERGKKCGREKRDRERRSRNKKGDKRNTFGRRRRLMIMEMKNRKEKKDRKRR